MQESSRAACRSSAAQSELEIHWDLCDYSSSPCSTNQAKPLFGAAPTTTTSSPFTLGGANNNNQPQQQQGGASLFGNTANKPATTSLFGAPATAAQPQQQQTGSSLFGNTANNTNTSNQQTGGGLFGASTTQQSQPQQTTSLFGAQPAAASNTTGSSLFGNTTNQNDTQNKPSLSLLYVAHLNSYALANQIQRREHISAPTIPTTILLPLRRLHSHPPRRPHPRSIHLVRTIPNRPRHQNRPLQHSRDNALQRPPRRPSKTHRADRQLHPDPDPIQRAMRRADARTRREPKYSP